MTGPPSSAPPPQALRAAVEAHLPGLGTADWEPLHGGRVNRLWRVGAVAVKLLDPDGGSPLFPNDAAAEAAALDLLSDRGLAPRLVARGRVGNRDWLATGFRAGQVWTSGAAAAAGALAAVHRAAVPGLRPAPTGSTAILAQGAAIAADCRATPPPPADPGEPPCPRPGLIHGDAVAGNLIVGPGGPGFIDWACAATGDPVDDLAAFLSPAMQALYRGRPLAAEEAEAILSAYPDPATVARYRRLAPLLHWRLAVHCLWRADRGAQDYARAARLALALAG
jgi:aminoglycoside phosphotransferase (APT) family kinase protein